MFAFLKLIRFKNLLIIGFTQYAIRHCLMSPILHLSNFNLQMQEWEFFLLVLATIFITAGGYIINDYFDHRIDAVNKPEKIIIDKEIKRRVAMGAHAVLSTVGVSIGIYIAWKSNLLLSGGTMFCLMVIGLWYYSTHFKYQFLTGNLIVSLLTATAPFMVLFFELPLIIKKYNAELLVQLKDYGFAINTTLLLWVGAYTLFAFLTTLIREILKDMEDMEGDKEFGCKTLPIVIGINKSKLVLFGLILITIIGIGVCQNYLTSRLKVNFSALYFLIFVQLPFLFLLIYIIRSKEKKQFHFASQVIKGIMLAGVCYLLFLKFFILK